MSGGEFMSGGKVHFIGEFMSASEVHVTGEVHEEVESLSQELQSSVDQAASASERAIRWEMKCERLRERLKELEQNIGWVGVDFELLSSSVVETNPVIIEQLERLKNFANKINDTLVWHLDDVSLVVDGVVDPADTLFTPETKEFAKRHTLRRAQLNSELQELNKLLEKKEKIATQFSMNDTKMAEMLDHMKHHSFTMNDFKMVEMLDPLRFVRLGELHESLSALGQSHEVQ
ncbi:hypothetical protein DPMN_107108 [Dreissena polymorpha]|uniref:Uncharacterized protein n=1 Tax=Dreissena polymorpha TaxID=45954 RepID=A0A9D4QKQ1_DREPO|nr:hypothetical protein DPMN_107108 [Dreissena polymorpha]